MWVLIKRGVENMNLIERFVAGRETSGLPLSIATSLAIESACGVHPEIPVKVAPVTVAPAFV